MKKINSHVKDIYIFVAISIVTALFLTKSPNHPWRDGVSYTDSSVFRTIAFMMKRGAKPYVDTFDHKGPLLYLINKLGDTIWECHGIWLIEYICLFFSCFLLFRVSKKIHRSSVYAVISVLFATNTLFWDFEGGNLTEEYSIPLITLSLYYFLDYFLNGKSSRFRWGIIGFCFGCVLLLRPNNAVLWAVICPIVFIETIRGRSFQELKNIVLWFSTGMGIAIIPILLWLKKIGALRGCWESYILFNFLYTGKNVFAKKWSAFLEFLKHPAVFLSFLMLILLYVKKRKKGIIYSLVYLFLTLVSASLSGNIQYHYRMIIAPALILPISLLFQYLETIKTTKKGMLSLIFLLLVICWIIVPDWKELLTDVGPIYENRNIRDSEKQEFIIAERIIQNTDPSDEITVFGNWDVLYLLSNRPHATKYSYQFPIGSYDGRIMEDYFSSLEQNPPKIIVIQPVFKRVSEALLEFAEKHDYELLWGIEESETEASIYIRN